MGTDVTLLITRGTSVNCEAGPELCGTSNKGAKMYSYCAVSLSDALLVAHPYVVMCRHL